MLGRLRKVAVLLTCSSLPLICASDAVVTEGVAQAAAPPPPAPAAVELSGPSEEQRLEIFWSRRIARIPSAESTIDAATAAEWAPVCRGKQATKQPSNQASQLYSYNYHQIVHRLAYFLSSGDMVTI